MGTRDLPDMYARSSMAAGPRVEGIHISQITRAHVTSNMYHFFAKPKDYIYSVACSGFVVPIYKEWHHYPGYKSFVPFFQGYITFVSLLFPLICPRKVVYSNVVTSHKI